MLISTLWVQHVTCCTLKTLSVVVHRAAHLTETQHKIDHILYAGRKLSLVLRHCITLQVSSAVYVFCKAETESCLHSQLASVFSTVLCKAETDVQCILSSTTS